PGISFGGSSQLAMLRGVFQHDLNAAGGTNGAYVLDLTANQALYGSKQSIGRLPASVQKLYTTATALLRYGPSARMRTTVYGSGGIGLDGEWHGDLYLRGGGDPTFGSRSFDTYAYGAGAT